MKNSIQGTTDNEIGPPPGNPTQPIFEESNFISGVPRNKEFNDLEDDNLDPMILKTFFLHTSQSI